ncbi:MAG: DUF3883 domain-containing protein [Planctomycetota bacterium]|nr:DUF3883 domain-containing protein [Planctomycetota bacterium]
MAENVIKPNARGHLNKLVEDLLKSGWTINCIPEDGQVPRNGIKLVLAGGNAEAKIRVFAYKITSSGRNKPHERRVEITTTYSSGLRAEEYFRDVVLGIDDASGKYVGIDSKRLKWGGMTHNASSFFDLEGLSVSGGNLLINPRLATKRLFPGGIELHAFFDRTRLAEYLFNQKEIHSGLYAFGGSFGGPKIGTRGAISAIRRRHPARGDAFVFSSTERSPKQSFDSRLISAVEQRDFTRLTRRKISPEQLKKILIACDEIGALGEQAVLVRERKRLTKLGFYDKAKKVERVSLKSIGEGYDILSFEDDGITKRYLEVKATSGRGYTVDISQGEWNAAKRLGGQYYVVRVINARTSPSIFYIRDPIRLQQQGLVTKTPSGWKLDLRLAMGLKRK